MPSGNRHCEVLLPNRFVPADPWPDQPSDESKQSQTFDPGGDPHGILEDEPVQMLDDDIDPLEDVDPTVKSKCVHAKVDTEDSEKLRPYFGFVPARTVRETTEATTQFFKALGRHPMRRHEKPRFPWHGGFRLNEVVSTDTFCANCKAFCGSTCAQAHCGLTSGMINVHGMTSESEMSNTHQDFCREEGHPSVLRRDNAKAQQSKKVLEINRDNNVKDQFSEAHNQQQNPVESRAMKWLKSQSGVLLDRTGAPPAARIGRESCIRGGCARGGRAVRRR